MLCLMFKRVVASFVLGLCATACGGDESAYKGARIPVSVMTRNLYLGSDITDVLLSPSVQVVPTKAAAFWATVLQSDFPARAKLLADEIVATSPDLIGLQEVEIYRQQIPSDFAVVSGVNATEVVIDFLVLLNAELLARGTPYTVVAENTLSDVELPVAMADGALMDLRMTDRDVILAKPGVVAVPTANATFKNYLAANIGGDTGPRVEVKRGYATAQVTVSNALGKANFVFGNAHLEVGGALRAFQEPQADELVTLMKAVKGPMVFVGDFNSPADRSETRSYGFLRSIFADSYETLGLTDPGYTCCMDLLAPGPTGMKSRIDLVLSRGDILSTNATLIGGVARTSLGLSASDHRGLVVTLGLVPLP